MARKLFRSGNSTVVSLPGEVLEVLDLDAGDEVSVTADPEGGRIVITPVARPLAGVEPDFLAQVDRFIDRYAPALERLAGDPEA
ncbi:MAG: AbrB/MazE/SpoVT family DNA-binding domain-containing protein [Anaerolineae bacterium]